ncbi:hypothetical protein T484DRAFT_1851794 [Baffinella frigidus]|nr:hypothetical protein T484DRAFT_1851794 [Cryptophyta sp. CCMP2293]
MTLTKCIIEDCGFNAGDGAHFWHASVATLEECEIHHCSYFSGVDDSASLFVRKCTVRDLLFEAFYAGGNAQHAEMTLLDNTIFGEMWWEHEDIWDPANRKELGSMLMRPGRLVEEGNLVLPRLPRVLDLEERTLEMVREFNEEYHSLATNDKAMQAAMTGFAPVTAGEISNRKTEAHAEITRRKAVALDNKKRDQEALFRSGRGGARGAGRGRGARGRGGQGAERVSNAEHEKGAERRQTMREDGG